MARKPKQYDDDDGRTIVSMDVEGMKWHDRQVRKEKRDDRSANRSRANQMTKSETRRFMWYAILAGLTVALVFSVVYILFILFATQVWLR
jgi:hypothetical protein